jgi:carboxymethylenebutenolidase
MREQEVTVETQGEQVAITVDGGTMKAYLCRPQGDGPFPAMLIVHEILGLTEHFEDLSCRFAAQGYVGLAPDLFWKIGPPPEFTDRASFMRFRSALDERQILDSMDAAVSYLRQLPSVDGARIGIVGFCWGGSQALLEATHNPAIAACIDFYGGRMEHETAEHQPRSPMEAARDLHSPFLGLFGQEDQGIPVEQVQRLESVVRESGVPAEFHIYPGAGHAFFNDRHNTYREHAAKDAWERVLHFLHQYLAPPVRG